MVGPNSAEDAQTHSAFRGIACKMDGEAMKFKRIIRYNKEHDAEEEMRFLRL